MSAYKAEITWKRNGVVFTDNKYPRAHLWQFDGGAEVPASSSPQVVPPPYSDSAAVDPEEAFLASLSSCHMLWFLSIAAKRGFVVDEYIDTAEAYIGKNTGGKTAITMAILRPAVKYSPDAAPTADVNRALHHEAHKKCFIANSVTTEIRIEPVMEISK